MNCVKGLVSGARIVIRQPVVSNFFWGELSRQRGHLCLREAGMEWESGSRGGLSGNLFLSFIMQDLA